MEGFTTICIPDYDGTGGVLDADGKRATLTLDVDNGTVRGVTDNNVAGRHCRVGAAQQNGFRVLVANHADRSRRSREPHINVICRLRDVTFEMGSGRADVQFGDPSEESQNLGAATENGSVDHKVAGLIKLAISSPNPSCRTRPRSSIVTSLPNVVMGQVPRR